MTEKVARRGAIVIRRDRCKACGWCIEHCPTDNIRLSADMNPHGYHFAEPVDEDNCTGCGQCALVCPDICITVYRAKR